eukprot:2265167-Pleurochrysis_carterae.AAC.3
MHDCQSLSAVNGLDSYLFSSPISLSLSHACSRTVFSLSLLGSSHALCDEPFASLVKSHDLRVHLGVAREGRPPRGSRRGSRGGAGRGGGLVAALRCCSAGRAPRLLGGCVLAGGAARATCAGDVGRRLGAALRRPPVLKVLLQPAPTLLEHELQVLNLRLEFAQPRKPFLVRPLLLLHLGLKRLLLRALAAAVGARQLANRTVAPRSLNLALEIIDGCARAVDLVAERFRLVVL